MTLAFDHCTSSNRKKEYSLFFGPEKDRIASAYDVCKTLPMRTCLCFAQSAQGRSGIASHPGIPQPFHSAWVRRIQPLYIMDDQCSTVEA